MWKTIQIPQMIYIPVIRGQGFDNLGLKVEPRTQDPTGNWTGDVLEISPGSNKVRINNVEYQMAISCDKLNVDEKGVLQLAKPKAPRALSTGGVNQATVGRVGTTRRTQENEDQQSTIDPIAQEFVEELDQYMKAENPDHEIREITLKDGSIAFARFDKKTGRQISTPFRQYQRHTAALSVTGTTKEHSRREPPTHAVKMAHRAVQVCCTGAEHLDDVIGAGKQELGGWPLRNVACLAGPSDITNQFAKTAQTTDSIVNAIGRVHMVKGQETIYVRIDNLNDELRLKLAEELPVLVELVKTKDVALVIVTPEWGDKTPALLKYMPTLRVELSRHPSDERFITAKIEKNDAQPKSVGQTTSFPYPK